MKVLVTGATGFVGGWLLPELAQAGHDVVGLPAPDVLDIADAPSVRAEVARVRPDAVVHLAGLAYAPDAAANAAEALRVNVGGTHAVLEACRRLTPACAVLVVGSADVYRPPEGDAALTEASQVAPRGVYGLTKLASEALGIAAGCTGELAVAVARPFNHTGPGQRPVFAIPAFARRVLDARAAGSHEIRAGNVDVARDISDVRDIVRAYRLLLEALVAGRVPADRPVYNIASGEAVAMRKIIDTLGGLAGWPVRVVVDPELVRGNDPPVMRGDATALRALTGWEPTISLDRTLADLMADLQGRYPRT